MDLYAYKYTSQILKVKRKIKNLQYLSNVFNVEWKWKVW